MKKIFYKIEISNLNEKESKNYEEYKYENGYLILYWRNENNSCWFQSGYITPQKLKEKLSEKQWEKFLQGKREFTKTI